MFSCNNFFLNCTFLFVYNDHLLAHSYMGSNIPSHTNNLHTVIWLAMFLSNTHDLYTIL